MNPYEVLGVREGASDAEIKAAYKELVKKYHPDKYVNNPLADLAQAKLQEINEAYDMLMKGGDGSYGGGSNSAEFMQVRKDIDSGNLDKAATTLQRSSNHSAEWFFLNGVVSARRGWYDDAMDNLETAVNMEPNNQEYARHYQSMANQGNMFRNRSSNMGYGGRGNDDLCCQALQCYICADCCCDCI